MVGETLTRNQIPPIQLKIKTYIENVDEIENIQYIRALLKAIRKQVEEQKQKIIEKLIEYKENDVCDLVPHLPRIVKIYEVPLTANGNVIGQIYYDNNYDLDYDLIIDKQYIRIQKNGKTIDNGDLYVAIKGWNKICGEFKVEKLLKDDDYEVEVRIIYRPRPLEEYDP